jgi:matrixin
MSHLRIRSIFLWTTAFAGTLTALFPWPGQGAQSAKTQPPGQGPAPTDSVQVPLEHYNHFDLEPGADFGAALQAIRALKERQAREWAWVRPPHDGQGGVEPFQIFPGTPDRWGTPGAYGQPEVITWSLAPDTAMYFPTVPNQLFSWMNNQFLTTDPTVWIWQIEAAFQRWSDMTGITFVRVQFQGNEWDDGGAYGLPGAPGLRGDIRLFAAWVDGGGGETLAFAEPPAGIPPGPSPGEITFDLEAWANPPWNPLYGFERTIHHEIGHAIGLDHTCPAQSNTKLMQPVASTPFGTPQHDDVRGAQALYGDPLEPNDTREQASYFQIYPHSPVAHVPALWPPPDSVVYPDGILGIDNSSDHDWFEFGVVTGVRMTVKVRPVGGPYQDWPVNPTTLQCPGTGGSVNSAAVTPLDVQIWRSIDANDDVLLAETAAPAGSIAQLTNVLLKYPGRYRIHVSGTPITVPKQSQQYELEVTWDGAPCLNNAYCSDGTSQNGTEICIEEGGCLFTYFDDDYNFDSILDSTQPWLGDCDSNGRVDIGETAYLTSGQARTKIRGQDDCDDAQPIAAGIDYEYMTYYATPDIGAGTPSSGEPGVWFSYTPQTNGVVSVQVRSQLQTPMELAVSLGSGCGAATLISGSQTEWGSFGQPLGQLAELTLEGQANVEHRIRVSKSWVHPYPAGDFTLRVDGPDDVTNDCDKNGTLDVCQTSAPDCNNNGIIDSCELVGATNHCLLSENLDGPGSIISAAGSLSVSANDLVLVAEGATKNMVGIFVASTSRLPVPEEGKICLAGTVLRLGSGVQVGPDGVAVMPLDLTQYPQMSAGSIWNFQFWFRDIGGPGIGYVDANVSDAIELKFCP